VNHVVNRSKTEGAMVAAMFAGLVIGAVVYGVRRSQRYAVV